MSAARAAGAGRPTGGRGRIAALALAAAVLAGGAAAAQRAGHPAPATHLQPATLAAEAAPAGAASSSWYCSAAPEAASSGGETTVTVANAGRSVVRGTLVVVGARGVERTSAFSVGAGGQEELRPASVLSGRWLAASVDVTGGAVSAEEVLHGRSGWSVAPCASEVSAHWYFATGATDHGSTMHVSLYNPTQTLAVADLSFVTSSGVTAPMPFQGLVIAPRTLRTVTVGTYVQHQGTVATLVSARSGALVAGLLELYGNAGAAGVSLTLGSPGVSRLWAAPRLENATGGSSQLTVFNPSDRSERVVVSARLPSGPVAPFSEVLGPRSLWTLTTSSQLRIATSVEYALEVRTGGPGVVVGRTGAGAPGSTASGWAAAVMVASAGMETTHRWLVPMPAGGVGPTGHGVLGIVNPGRHAVRVRVTSLLGAGRSTRVVELAPNRFDTLALGDAPVLVSADGPLAVTGDASPAGGAGAVEVPAVPQA